MTGKWAKSNTIDPCTKKEMISLQKCFLKMKMSHIARRNQIPTPKLRNLKTLRWPHPLEKKKSSPNLCPKKLSDSKKDVMKSTTQFNASSKKYTQKFVKLLSLKASTSSFTDHSKPACGTGTVILTFF